MRKVFCDLEHERLPLRVRNRPAKCDLLPRVPTKSNRQRHTRRENCRLPRSADRHLELAVDERIESHAGKVRKDRQQDQEIPNDEYDLK